MQARYAVVGATLLLIVHMPLQGTFAQSGVETKATIRLALERLQSRLPSITLQEDWEQIAGELWEKKELHAERGRSEERAREVLSQGLSKFYDGEAERILSSLEPAIREKLFSDREQEQIRQIPAEILERNLNSNFSQYDKLRESVVAKQRELLTTQLFPSASDYELKTPQQLRKELLDAHQRAAGDALFAENLQYLNQYRVEPVLKLAEQQRQKQRETLSAAGSGGKLIPAEIRMQLEAELERLREELAQGEDHVYSIFPSVLQTLPDRAQELAIEALRQYILSREGEVDSAALEALILKSPAVHANPKSSWTIIIESYAAALKGWLPGHYCAQVAEEQRQSLQRQVEAWLERSAILQQAVMNLSANALRAPFGEARSSVARQQLGEIFPDLARSSWRPSYELVDSYFGEAAKVEHPLRLEGIPDPGPKKAELLEETESLLRSAAEAALQLGLDALNRQLEIVGEAADPLEDYLRKESPLPTLETAIKILTGMVVELWAKDELAKEFPELWDRVKVQIDIRAKAMLQREATERQVKQHMAKERIAAESIPKPGGGTGAGNSSGQGDGVGSGAGGDGSGSGKMGLPFTTDLLDRPDLLFDFRLEGSEVLVSVSTRQAPEPRPYLRIPSQVCETPELVLQHCTGLPNRLAEWVEQAARMAPKDQDGYAKIYVAARIWNGHVPYGVVAGFRQAFFEALKIPRGSSLKVRVYWIDLWHRPGVTDEEFFKDYRERSRPLFA